jgi:FKBP-type peptidyl-prolyl cis-trans isomerase FklB
MFRFAALSTAVCRAAAGLTASALLAGPALAQAQAPEAAPLQSLKDKMSYATGVMTARNLLKNGVPFDLDLMVQGLRDGMAGGDIRMPEKELKLVLQSMQAEIQRKISAERSVKAGIARENGLAYQAEYAKKPGVQVLPGNLMVRVLKEGQGDKAGDAGTVVVRYRGTLVDGSEFDATPEGKTATVKLVEAIPGWREALKRMPAGSTWEIVVPPGLAYAARGNGTVGPNETLVFTVDLVAVVQ